MLDLRAEHPGAAFATIIPTTVSPSWWPGERAFQSMFHSFDRPVSAAELLGPLGLSNRTTVSPSTELPAARAMPHPILGTVPSDIILDANINDALYSLPIEVPSQSGYEVRGLLVEFSWSNTVNYSTQIITSSSIGRTTMDPVSAFAVPSS